MKLSIRPTVLAITALTFAGAALGAQQRSNGHAAAPRAQAPRGHMESRGGMGSQHAAPAHAAPSHGDFRGGREAQARNDPRSRPDYRGRNDGAGRQDFRGRNEVGARPDFRGREEFRGRDGYRVPVAVHGRPLITRAGFGRPGYGVRYGAGFNRWGGRLALPFGWESRLYVRGFFPVSYVSYCEAVPPEYDYMLPEMLPNYDSCLFGDRIVVMDRFSRGIVFTAILQ